MGLNTSKTDTSGRRAKPSPSNPMRGLELARQVSVLLHPGFFYRFVGQA
jgi:hypothetical protein